MRKSVKLKKCPSETLTFWQKLVLAVGAGPLSLSLVTSLVYIQSYLLETAEVKPTYVSIILFSARVFDAMTDPVVGSLVNKSQSRRNNLRLWMGSSLPFLIIFYCILWYVPLGPSSQVFLFLYYFTVYISLQLSFTFYTIPFSGLIMYQSKDPEERDKATAFRMSGEIFFAICGVSIHMTVSLFIPPDENAIKEVSNSQKRHLVCGLIVSIVMIITGLISFLFSTVRRDIFIPASNFPVSTSVKHILMHRPFQILMLTYLSAYSAVNVTQSCLLLYFKYALKLESHFHAVMLILMVSSAVSIPFWQRIILCIGKKKTSYISVSILVPCFSLLFIMPSLPYYFILIYPCAVIMGMGCGNGYYIPWAMLPDVIDSYTVVFKERDESLFFGMFVFLSKLAAGLVTGISTLLLDYAGYDNKAQYQPDSVVFTLRAICSLASVVLVIIFGVMLWVYPLTESINKQNKEILELTFYNKHVFQSNNIAHTSRPSDVTLVSLNEPC